MNIEEIEGLLLQLPDVVSFQEDRWREFLQKTNAWLTALEQVLVANRLYQAGGIAALRSGLAAAERGLVPDGLEFHGRPTRSRVMITVASQAVQRATEMVTSLLAENRSRLADGERVALQIAAVARSRGVPSRAGGGNTAYLRTLRRTLSASADLENALIHLEGLVGPHDALILVDRALTADQDITRNEG